MHVLTDCGYGTIPYVAHTVQVLVLGGVRTSLQ